MKVSAEEENFIKITKIIIDIVPKYLRKLFLHYWSKRYSGGTRWSDDTSAMMLLNRIPITVHNNEKTKHYINTIKSVEVGAWSIQTLVFLFLESGMRLFKGCRSVNKRNLPLRVSEEIDIIRKVRSDFFADPSSMQCSSIIFREVTSKIKSVARNIFGVDAVNEIDETMRSKITTTLTIEKLKQRLPMKNPVDDREELFSGKFS